MGMIFDDDEYNAELDYGFKFEYRNRRVGESISLDSDDMEYIGENKGNDDNLFIFCDKCSCYMDFLPGKNNALDGKWKCPNCGKSVRESTPYHQLDKENESFASSGFDDYDPDDCFWNPFDD